MAKPATRRKADHPSENHVVATSQRPATVSPEDRKVQIAAAKARVTLDKRLGEDTPEWIIALSQEKPE
ncbi:hypothetical protein AB4Z38_02755 [Arthrobacter sp. 2RAF6]|uniref:hypothetical protein n=1 Tax=Arthrobacter sp. 2RAF6 TaxID=3233002 RepID=UPI003F905441